MYVRVHGRLFCRKPAVFLIIFTLPHVEVKGNGAVADAI